MDNNETGKISEATVVDEPKSEITIDTSKDNNTQRGQSSAPIVLATIALLLGCAGLGLGWVALETASKPVTILSSGSDGNSANFVEGSIADVANKVSESVVSIISSTKSVSIFGKSYTSGASGTGIIVSKNGYILTNKHVIDGATTISVVLDDGTTYENVNLASVDPLNDVAFLKIDNVSDLKAATLGDSKTINVGQQVIAIGNALGQYQNTVTSGIISGTGRSLTASDESGSLTENLSDMIQTDAAINSGNSGGPLVNAAGEVIGINTATSVDGENVGFAIPISSIKGMLGQLVETGEAKRAYVGVYSLDITPEVAKQYNLPVGSGTYVYNSEAYSAVLSGGPAAKAGIRDKDIILAVNGVKVGVSGSLSSLVGEYKPGDTVSLTVYRDGKEVGIKVELGAYTPTK